MPVEKTPLKKKAGFGEREFGPSREMHKILENEKSMEVPSFDPHSRTAFALRTDAKGRNVPVELSRLEADEKARMLRKLRVLDDLERKKKDLK